MSLRLGINLEVNLNSVRGDIPLDEFSRVLKAVNDSAFESELRDLTAVEVEFPELPQVALDASAHRIRQYRKSAITITSARTGSIILVVAVGALSYYVLQQTLGETLKEAWHESESHQRIKSFLLKRRGDKARQLADDVLRRVRKVTGRDTTLERDLVERSTQPSTIRLRAMIERPEEIPPSLENAFPEEDL